MNYYGNKAAIVQQTKTSVFFINSFGEYKKIGEL